jgi:DNA ligase-1
MELGFSMEIENILNLYVQFERLKNSTKKQEKIDCLTDYKDDELFCFVLEFLLNTDKKTGLSSSKLDKKVNENLAIQMVNLEALINYLLKNNSGRDIDIATAQKYINDLSNFTLSRFISELITKKYKCGVTKKVASVILPEVVKNEHEIMLASKFEGKLKEEVSISLKLDGIRCTALIENGTITFKTRQGKLINGLVELTEALKQLNIDNIMLDGELLRINNDNKPSDENFRLTTEIVNSKSDNKTNLEFVLFDSTPIESYYKKEDPTPYSDRINNLKQIIPENDFVRIVPMYGTTNDVDVIYDTLNVVTEQGLEGLMLNTLSGLYKFGKRSKDVLKVKAMQTCDIECIGIEEGEGKYTNTLGKIICSYKGYKLKVGSGFTDEQRDYYWNNPGQIMNKIVEIQYFEESSDKEGNLSLRFPVFKQVRNDKNEESYE